MSENTDRIAEIKDLLRSGATEINVGGNVIKIDPASLRRELMALEQIETPNKRPLFITIGLDN